MRVPSRFLKPSNAVAYLLGFIGVLCFAATLPLTEVALRDFSPLFITSIRAVIAGGLAVCVILMMRQPQPAPDEWRPLLMSGCALIFGFPMAMAVGLEDVPSYHGAVVLGVLPLLTAVLSVFVHGERPSPRFWGWSLVGAMLVLSFVLLEHEGQILWADLWLVLAALMAASGYVIAGDLSRRRPGWWVISWSLIGLLPVGLSLSWVNWPAFLWVRPAESLYALAGLGVFSMFIGFFAWNAALAMGGIAQIGQVQLLQVFFTLFWGWVILDESFSVSVVMFAILVVSTVFLGRRAAQTPASDIHTLDGREGARR
jgi:drug/metabolite transporter (DMT)-like permease